jgi:hypothetical protein
LREVSYNFCTGCTNLSTLVGIDEAPGFLKRIDAGGTTTAIKVAVQSRVDTVKSRRDASDNVIEMDDLNDIIQDIGGPIRKTQWGNWKLDRTAQTLDHAVESYFVPLGDMRSAAAMLDWIFQLQQKTWVTPQDISDFLEALDDIFHPQHTMCGGGVERPFDVDERLKQMLG